MLPAQSQDGQKNLKPRKKVEGELRDGQATPAPREIDTEDQHRGGDAEEWRKGPGGPGEHTTASSLREGSLSLQLSGFSRRGKGAGWK